MEWLLSGGDACIGIYSAPGLPADLTGPLSNDWKPNETGPDDLK